MYGLCYSIPLIEFVWQWLYISHTIIIPVAVSSLIHITKMVLWLLLFAITLLISASGTSTTVIYVDTDSGTMDLNCWTGGTNLPCKDYDLAKKGALHLKANVKIIPSKTESCHQTWMYDSNGTCLCGQHISGAFSCNNNQVSILNCYCMTYDDVDVIVGRCPYGCQFVNRYSIWNQQVPLDPSKLNNIMCGWLNRESQLCGKCRFLSPGLLL